MSRSEEAVKKWAEALDIPEDQADHDLAIIENRRGLVPMGPRPEERPLGRTVPDHEVRPSMEGR